MFYSLKSFFTLSISLSLVATTSLAAGGPPIATGVINPNGNTAKCLDVRGGVFADGTPVQIYDCNGTAAQQWDISRGATTRVQLANSGLCLDAGPTPGPGVGMKLRLCLDFVPAQSSQTWTYTPDNRIALTGRGMGIDDCLDLTNGVLTNSNQIQTWTCTDNNSNQIWTTPI